MINQADKLEELVGRLRHAEWVGIDTEADSLHAYPEKLCLVQISSPAGDELVDPLAGLDLGPLLDVFGSRELILHGSDYDLRLLYRTGKFIPHAIFDTMIASRLCGDTEFGLASLVLKYLGLTLEKGSQKADWSRRPLTARMEEYARNDTKYLKPLSDLLRQNLESKGRMDWMRESCARLVVDSTREPDEAVARERWRLSGCNRLSRRGMAVLRRIWQWREETAIALNRPPFFVLSHDLLISVADAASQNQPVEPLLPPRLPHRRSLELLQAVEAGRQVPAEEWPMAIRQPWHRVTESEKRRFVALKKKRDDVAAALGLDPTLIAAKADLTELSRDPGGAPGFLMEWQRKLMFD